MLLSAALWAGCTKEVSFRTDYVLKPLVQQASGDVYQPVEGAAAYAFAADTAQWTVASYDDALKGVLTSRVDPAQKLSEPLAVAEPDPIEGFEGRLRMTLDRESQLVVAVDPVNRLYAYTQQKNGENLPSTYVTVVFKPYREGFSYKDGNWIFKNDFYERLVALDCYFAPAYQLEEGGAVTDYPVSSSAIKAYAFVADTTLWRIASYEDAANGVITSKSDGEQRRDTPNFTAYPEDGAYRMTVNNATLMLVVVDRTRQMYAYCQQAVDLEGAAPTFRVTFQPWRETYLYVEEGWRVVDDTYKPEEEEETEQPPVAGLRKNRSYR